MKRYIGTSILAVLVMSGNAQANCYGSDSYYNCNDYKSGNRYSVQKYGNTTQMRGSNSRTGSQWNQTTQKYGNTTQHRGTTNGKSWNLTQRQLGNTTYYSGTDSSGRSINCQSGRYINNC